MQKIRNAGCTVQDRHGTTREDTAVLDGGSGVSQ